MATIEEFERIVRACGRPRPGENLNQYLERLMVEAEPEGPDEGWREDNVVSIFGPREVDPERVQAARRSSGERE